MRILFDELQAELERVLRKLGFTEERAAQCARLFAETSRDGVYSHGLNRFPRFVEMIRRGVIDVHAEPERVGWQGVLEQWDGHLGPGNLNAYACMERAIALCREHGMGCVALRNTNHWMRGGTYGWQAAEAGVIGLCWSNTMPNLPPWGAQEARIGNNPFILAVPRREGPVVLDIAMSQFSYGALSSYRMQGKRLPVAGGFDEEGRLTHDPGAIEASERPLPIGFWKGSGLSFLLDLIGALLSGGKATHQLPRDPLEECGQSQVFLTFQPAGTPEEADQLVQEAVAYLHGAAPAEADGHVRYPGEGTLTTRRENLARGIPVEPALWEEVKEM